MKSRPASDAMAAVPIMLACFPSQQHKSAACLLEVTAVRTCRDTPERRNLAYAGSRTIGLFPATMACDRRKCILRDGFRTASEPLASLSGLQRNNSSCTLHDLHKRLLDGCYGLLQSSSGSQTYKYLLPSPSKLAAAPSAS